MTDLVAHGAAIDPPPGARPPDATRKARIRDHARIIDQYERDFVVARTAWALAHKFSLPELELEVQEATMVAAIRCRRARRALLGLPLHNPRDEANDADLWAKVDSAIEGVALWRYEGALADAPGADRKELERQCERLADFDRATVRGNIAKMASIDVPGLMP